MCGIVGAVAERNVQDILLEGLRRLEYRGYDSAGMAVLSRDARLNRQRAVGKVAALEACLDESPLIGTVGIAHTRWATHGRPNERNAHPHQSGESLAVVHNGIIENHEPLRTELEGQGYVFTSETDTEVVAHLLAREFNRSQDLLTAVQSAVAMLDGAYALAVMHKNQPEVIVGARKGSPLVVGVGIEEAFLASDPLALLPVTDRFIYLQEGDVVRLAKGGDIAIYEASGNAQTRPVQTFEHGDGAATKDGYRHFMLKEIHEQPQVIAATLEGRLTERHALVRSFGLEAEALFAQVRQIHIIACGTSYHAGLVARYWLEKYAGLPTQVEVASEYRYRQVVVPEGTLFVTLSQSGETADTLAALRFARDRGYVGSLAICNVPGSSLVRESDLTLLTQAGPEIGVASTKAFTTQLVGLMLLTLSLGRMRGMDDALQARVVQALRELPQLMGQVLGLDGDIETLSMAFAEKHHALFLGRGAHYPIALEGALKLKEISYIHAEAYPAGELKHGPLALVDSEMPVISVAPNDELLEKLKSNLQEVRARGGELFVFADERVSLTETEGVRVLRLPHVDEALAPILYTLPLQLLSYHVAVLKGTDVDQPRNLAKSVTVE
ncbi:glutamine--fructose-6-phosphate transaminase (isomerizing) [Halomonas sp. McH1-25]|uniref:glutamine--fructose-6-phosphate transaminase (isomerizing) n=1 Tax=unclassified Halomonas TaxID=2609666 RepID=UPI001EF64963|nr:MULTISPECIES: glutamine--fructose-6-phosphate transaminase (isomerizing) [unclassified Halomonas]MCG7599657.1 glutamine--fructose-6-phosphate transaminase (isomerizing) [Halomonas sp. McH1-25]MCP1342577.1 glutamine--fructose-6-phosphate transaminase (isomerizing) [Halomonas sp. FL8]MCP1361429.1 glutamine--fructose-6-phosphate transaminase (isomerizing) [Halomonas sp. BBD45]MCP1364603.1 glutamine--fructose-6-phosphate transaminase (isomerizing) [Halomonas sp. BBD48]